MKYFEYNNITKDELNKLREEDLMFITNPGRMGDEDGSNFIIKKENSLIRYRASNWMYNTEKCLVKLSDMEKVFPCWSESWKNSQNENYVGKYKYIYMGFGNGLCVDRSISDIFEKFLEEIVAKKAKEKNADISDYSLKYISWEEAAIKTANELGWSISLKK